MKEKQKLRIHERKQSNEQVRIVAGKEVKSLSGVSKTFARHG